MIIRNSLLCKHLRQVDLIVFTKWHFRIIAVNTDEAFEFHCFSLKTKGKGTEIAVDHMTLKLPSP